MFFEIRVERFASGLSACAFELLAFELSAFVELSTPELFAFELSSPV